MKGIWKHRRTKSNYYKHLCTAINPTQITDNFNKSYKKSISITILENRKKGKAGVMLFGTTKRLAKNERNLEISYNKVVLNKTTRISIWVQR